MVRKAACMRLRLGACDYMRMSSAIQVINIAGWLQNSVQPEWTFLLPLSLVWLSHAVIYCLSLGCLMGDANWPPFPLSSAQMKRFPPSCDGACHNLIRQIKKLTAVTLSSFEAPCLISYNDDFSSLKPLQCTAKHNTWEGRLLQLCAVCVTSECLWSVKSSVLLYFKLYMKIFLLSRAKFQFMPNFSKFPFLHWFNYVNLMFAYIF